MDVPSPAFPSQSWPLPGRYVGIVVSVGVLIGGLFWPAAFEVLSVIVLAMIGVVCWQIFETRRSPGASLLSGSARIWMIMAIGFGFLALDEALSLHENIDRFIHWAFEIKKTRFTDRIDDVIVLIYGILGVAILYFHRSEFRQLSGFRRFLVVGFLLFALMVLLDIGTNRGDVLLSLGVTRSWLPAVRNGLEAGEELVKLVAELVFLAGFFQIRRQFQQLREGEFHAAAA